MGLYDVRMKPEIEPQHRSIELRLQGSSLVLGQWDFEGSLFRGFSGWGGVAQGTAWLAQRLEEVPDEPALVLAVGECIVRGLPTAARATVMARAPSSGLFASGQVGGELGPALAWHADFLALSGRCESGGVLRLRSDRSVELSVRPDLLPLETADVAQRLQSDFGTAAILCTGPLAEQGLPFASLAAGVDPPSFVGRGGLGAVLSALGLKAIVIETPAKSAETLPEALALTRALARSPRAAARAIGGTFELFGAMAARGEATDRESRAFYEEADARRVERKGCRGCPTPCGWIFEEDDTKRRQGGRFSANQALGTALGLERFEDSLRLLARCDRLGIDAREAGTILALLIELGEKGMLADAPRRGDLDALDNWLKRFLHDTEHPARFGARALSRRFGLVDASHQGQSLRQDSNLATLLGQCVSGGGVDPMRSLPFLTELGDRARMEALIGLPLPLHAEDPRATAGKGRIVVWSENLIQAVDATGFCAFSTVGLLADGVLSLDELAQFILPAALAARPGPDSPGERLLGLGATLVALRRQLDTRLGGRASPPEFARERLSEAGMLPEYETLRGIARAVLAWGELDIWPEERRRWIELGRGPSEPGPTPLPLRREVQEGRVSLRTSGALAGILGREYVHKALLPMPLEGLVHAVCEHHPRARRWLFVGGDLLPGFWRGGARLERDVQVEAGDVLDVVLAISGG